MIRFGLCKSGGARSATYIMLRRLSYARCYLLATYAPHHRVIQAVVYQMLTDDAPEVVVRGELSAQASSHLMWLRRLEVHSSFSECREAALDQQKGLYWNRDQKTWKLPGASRRASTSKSTLDFTRLYQKPSSRCKILINSRWVSNFESGQECTWEKLFGPYHHRKRLDKLQFTHE